jgi:hypothetical protein
MKKRANPSVVAELPIAFSTLPAGERSYQKGSPAAPQMPVRLATRPALSHRMIASLLTKLPIDMQGARH